MGITGILIPLAVICFLAAAALLILGLRNGNRHMTFASVLLFLLLAVGYALFGMFVTSM